MGISIDISFTQVFSIDGSEPFIIKCFTILTVDQGWGYALQEYPLSVTKLNRFSSFPGGPKANESLDSEFLVVQDSILRALDDGDLNDALHVTILWLTSGRYSIQ